MRDESNDQPMTLAAAAEMGGAGQHTAPCWMNPAGSQGYAQRPLGAFDPRRLNPVRNEEAAALTERAASSQALGGVAAVMDA